MKPADIASSSRSPFILISIIQAWSANIFRQVWLFYMRQDVRFGLFIIRGLKRHNLRSHTSVLDVEGPVVSLTSFGIRLDTVYLTIESIGRGDLRPSRLILWIQDKQTLESRPQSLKRLEQRGLEVLLTQNYGPHSKYYPYLQASELLIEPLVTADDDIIYSRWWLQGLNNAHCLHPDAVNCYRAHVLGLTDGLIQRYATWRACRSARASLLHFATGSSGCIYPAEMLMRLKAAAEGFVGVCDKADDVWLHAIAVKGGFPIRQVSLGSLNFPTIPNSQDAGLFNENVGGGNDIQIKRTYGLEHLTLLRAESAPTITSSARRSSSVSP